MDWAWTVGGAVVAVLGGWPFAAGVLWLAGQRGERGLRARDRLRGGLWIGLLERIGVYAALLLGATEVVTMVLAVKGLGRYPELRSGESPEVAERFIIGTFASILWAAGCAGLVWLLW